MKKYKRLSLLLAIVILLVNSIPALTAESALLSSDGYQTYQGSRYYYNLLAAQSYGQERQALYDYVVTKAEELHRDFTTNYPDENYTTIQLKDFFPDDFFQREEDGSLKNDIDQVVSDTVRAVLDDNVQYFFLDDSVGMTFDYESCLLYFYQPMVTEQYPSLDFGQAADRSAMRDMIDVTFAKYKELTQNASSNYEIARLVHDQIASDWDYSSSFPATEAPGIHDLFGGMGYATNGLVCDGYSKMYSFILNNLGVQAIVVTGHSMEANGDFGEGHAWNIVQMDDGYLYYVDLTWADTQKTNADIGNYKNYIDHSWFLLGIDSGRFEARHYAGPGSYTPSIYERPANMGGADYNYQSIHADYQFLTDLPAARREGLDVGTYPMPADGTLDIQPGYYDTDLVYGSDYEVRYEEPLRLGKNRVWFVGKGNYRGMDFGTVNLSDAGIPIALTVSTAVTCEYFGTPVTPEPVVKNGNTVLQKGIDYTVSYQNNEKSGTAKVIVTGLGIYAGTYEKEFQIISMLGGTKITAAEFSQLYPALKNAILVILKRDGSEYSEYMHNDPMLYIQKAANTYGLPVYYLDANEADLTEFTFFRDMLDKFYSNSSYVGINYYPLIGIFGSTSDLGVYAASAQLSDGLTESYPFFTEERARAEIAKYISLEDIVEEQHTYGITLTPAANKDFGKVTEKYAAQKAHSVTISNTGNQAAGPLKISLSGRNAASFTLNQTAIADIAVGAGKSFTVVPKTNLGAGSYSATVTVSGANVTARSFTVSFQVSAAAISRPPSTVTTVKKANTIKAANIVRTAVNKKQAVAIRAKTAYKTKLTYKSNIKSITVNSSGVVTIAKNYAGKATITITAAATNQYAAKVLKITVTVKRANIIKAANIIRTTASKKQTVSIKARTADRAKLSYKSNNRSIIVNRSGTVAIAKNYVGKATITITAAATSKYAAKVHRITVTAIPKAVTITQLKNTPSKRAVVQWRRNKDVTGYQISYALTSKFKKAKTATVKSNRITKKTISGLAKKRVYYVRIRSYKKVAGKVYYSQWSKSKRIRITK